MLNYLSSFDIWKVVELMAIVFGFWYVLLEIKKTRTMWRALIIASMFNLAVFAHKQFWAMAAIQIYYIITSIYGIFQWSKVIDAAIDQYGEGDRQRHKEVPIVRMNARKAIISAALAIAAATVFVVVTLRGYEPSPGDIPGKPYWDSAVAAMSMLATYWLSQSYFEQWIIWIVVNVSGIVMFLYPIFAGYPHNALPGMGLLYVAYLVISIEGPVNWKKNGVIIDTK